MADRGHVEPADWADVTLGHIVQDKKDRMHTVVGVSPDGSKVKLNACRTGEEVILSRPSGAVNIYVPSESECKLLLLEELGARILRDIEDREHTIARSLLWRLDPVARTAKSLRDHMDMIHGEVYAEDQLYRHQKGVDLQKSAKARHDADGEKEGARLKKASLDMLAQMHDEMHADPHLHPMGFPHHHAKIGATS